MKKIDCTLGVLVSFVLLASLAGCGGVGNGGRNRSTGGGNPPGTLGPTTVLFVANSTSNTISVFSMSTSTGALTEITGSPFPTGTQPLALAVALGKFLYVANAGSNTVSGFTIGSGGILTGISGLPTGAGPDVNSMATNGSFLYVGQSGGNIFAYSIDPVTGALTPSTGSPFLVGGTRTQFSLAASGNFLFASD